MKKIFFLAVLSGMLMGCNKSLNETPSIEGGVSASVVFNFSSVGGTKAVDVGVKSADEALVNHFDAFVFNASGDLDAYSRFEAGSFSTVGGVTSNTARLACSTGAGKEIYILVNSPWSVTELESISSETALLAKAVYDLRYNYKEESSSKVLKNFQMCGYKSTAFVPGENDVAVNVAPVVSRVKVNKIKTAFVNSGLQNDALRIKDIYVSNVPATFGFGDGLQPVYKVSGATDPWYNKYKYDAQASPKAFVDFGTGDPAGPWLHRTPATPIAMGGDFVDVDATFYVMPNDYQKPVGDITFADMPFGGTSWSPRHTKLVIETEYASKTYFYVIPIFKNDTYPVEKLSDFSNFGGIAPNFSYEIDKLVITRLGTTNPDEPVMAADLQFDITVAPWNVVPVATNNSGEYVI